MPQVIGGDWRFDRFYTDYRPEATVLLATRQSRGRWQLEEVTLAYSSIGTYLEKREKRLGIFTDEGVVGQIGEWNKGVKGAAKYSRDYLERTDMQPEWTHYHYPFSCEGFQGDRQFLQDNDIISGEVCDLATASQKLGIPVPTTASTATTDQVIHRGCV